MRAGKQTGLAVALAAVVVASITVSAHRRDEYLHAARLAVEPGRVDLELDLTPGIAVAEVAIADLDRDRDGTVSPAEQVDYVSRALGAVVLDIDGHALLVEPISSTFPALNDIRRGDGTIRIHAGAALPPQAAGDHHLSFRNTDRLEANVYLSNALAPRSARIVITAQQRDPEQRALTIDYVLRPAPGVSMPTWLVATFASVAVLAALLVRPSQIA